MTDELLSFLRARFDDDEEEARRGYLKTDPAPEDGGWNQSTTAGLPPAVGVRMLREIEGKRRIAEEAEALFRSLIDGAFLRGDEILKQLAWPYQDHPEFRTEWLP